MKLDEGQLARVAEGGRQVGSLDRWAEGSGKHSMSQRPQRDVQHGHKSVACAGAMQALQTFYIYWL